MPADRLGGGAGLGEDLDGEPVLDPDDPEQEVLGADVIAPDRERLAERELERLLRVGGERDLTGRGLVTRADKRDHPRARLVESDSDRLKHACGDVFVAVEETEEQML